MRYELSNSECATIKPFLPNKSRGVPRVNDRRVLNGIFWVLRSGARMRSARTTPRPCVTRYGMASQPVAGVSCLKCSDTQATAARLSGRETGGKLLMQLGPNAPQTGEICRLFNMAR